MEFCIFAFVQIDLSLASCTYLRRSKGSKIGIGVVMEILVFNVEKINVENNVLFLGVCFFGLVIDYRYPEDEDLTKLQKTFKEPMLWIYTQKTQDAGSSPG